MAVENVFKPKTVNPVDPKVAAEKGEGDRNYWERKRDEAKARLDYEEYVAATKKLGDTPEPPFKIKGEVNLGTFNLQDQQNLAQERADKAIKDKDAEIKVERGRANTAEQQLQDQKIETIRQEFQHGMDDLHKVIEKLTTTNPKDNRPIYEQFKEQYTALQETAKALGYEKTSAGRDPMVELEIAKLGFQQAREDREFQWKMEQDKREFDLKLIGLKDDKDFKQAQLAQQARKDEMFANLPQTIGGAIAKGLLEGQPGVAGQPGNIGQKQPAPQNYHMEIPIGEAGTIPCPNCKTPIGVGPTQTLAECVNCKAQYPITRVAQSAAQELGSEPLPQNYAEEDK
jgi:hypothetical protein